MAEGTLVLTAEGPRPIQDIRPGDTVYSHIGEPIKVKETFSNGQKEVISLRDTSGDTVEATADHVFLTPEGQRSVKDLKEFCTISTPGGSQSIWKTEETRVVETYDIHVDSPENLYLLANGLVTHNSGKSASAAREVAWLLNDNHPYLKREEKWGDKSLTILIVGQSKKMVDAEIWSGKIAPFLNLKDWKISRSSGGIEMAENKQTGDRIVFLSHADSSEKNRKNLQGYTAQYVWVDEMPSSAALFQEIQARSATDGLFVATFSPKFKSDSVRRVVDSIEPPYGKVYRLSMLDNPILDKDKEIAKLEGYPTGYKNAVLYGDWYVGDSQVYEWEPERMVAEPVGYSRAWPHIESVDPALKSKFGYTMWAQQPSTGIWFLIRDDYIEKIYSPDDMVKEVQKRSSGYNIIRRVCDPHEAWYIGQAAKAGLSYTSPYDKNNRKSSLIKGLQFSLSKGKIKIAPWALTFQEEVSSCQWSETADNRMINSSSYHTLDCAQYFVDCMPRDKVEAVGLSWEEQLRQGNQERKRKEKQAEKYKGSSRVKPVGSWGRRGVRKFG